MRKKAVILFFIVAITVFFVCFLNNASQKNSTDKAPAIALNKLGRYLFFDTRLSFNNTKSCGSCHDPKFVFTDGYRTSITSIGENVLHNSPSLINASLLHYYDWANPLATTLEKQHERPLFNQHPIELGAKGNEAMILQRLKSDTFYQRMFTDVFTDKKDPFNFTNVIHCIAEYVRTLQSSNAAYDRFVNGDTSALSNSAKAGMQLFFSPQLKCAECHAPPYFTLATQTKNMDSIYVNTGLYNVLNQNKYPLLDNGLMSFSHKLSDDGKFKIPSLRNVALTAPYMHDGSVNTLNEVLGIYARGGRNITKGPFSGDGKNNIYKDKRITGFALNEADKKHLVDFLYSLTDSSILVNPSFQNPFEQGYK